MKRLILLFLFLSSPVAAQDFDAITGNGFLAICSRDDPVSKTACNVYVQGMSHMLLATTINGQMRPIYCGAENTTANQTRDMLLAYLRANPGIRHLGTPQIYMAVLSQAFPCAAAQSLPPLEKRF